MGAIKPNNYSGTEIQLSLIARALAHPARIKMVKLLRSGNIIRNVDLAVELNLREPTIREHLWKLKDAELIHIDYHPHFYSVSLNEKKLIHLSGFICEN
jgi:DNA-binding transcriptional ArsR family regulator